MLAGLDQRVVVVAVRRFVDGLDLPAVALDVVGAHVRGLGRAEGAHVHGGEVRGVEEVVGELQRAHRGATRRGLCAREGRVVPFRELVQIAHRFVGREPHETESFAHRVRRIETCARREDRVGAEGGDGGGASIGGETPAVVPALELAGDDASGAQRREPVGTAIAVRAQLSLEARDRPRFAEQPHLQRSVAQLVDARDRVPAVSERRGDVVENSVVDGDILVAMVDDHRLVRSALFTESQRPPR